MDSLMVRDSGSHSHLGRVSYWGYPMGSSWESYSH